MSDWEFGERCPDCGVLHMPEQPCKQMLLRRLTGLEAENGRLRDENTRLRAVCEETAKLLQEGIIVLTAKTGGLDHPNTDCRSGYRHAWNVATPAVRRALAVLARAEDPA